MKTIAIFTYRLPGMAPWDPDSINTGITGSEEAVIYISEKLIALGYQVIVFGTPPKNSRYSSPESNPRYVDSGYNDGSVYDIAVAWRMPKVAPELVKRAKTVYLWPHGLFSGPLTEEECNGFCDVFWLSKWQREQWIAENALWGRFKTVFGNGINPDQLYPVKERTNPYSCIYSSNYGHGLEILLDIWPEIRAEFPAATLDIYYGWQHWGVLTQPQQFKMMVRMQCLSELGVTDHGLVGHAELNKAFSEASFWTYPCTARETFCITALRAQLSGAVPVIIESAGLKETVRHGYRCHSPDEYLQTLRTALRAAQQISLDDRKRMGEFVLKEFTWEKIAAKWHALFE